MKRKVMLLAGAGQIGMEIARRTGFGKKIIVGDKKREHAEMVAKSMNEAGFDAVPVEMDLSSRESIFIKICLQTVRQEDRGRLMKWQMWQNCS